MAKKITLPESEIEEIRQKARHAIEDAQKQSEITKKNTDAYYRRPLGNEKEGRARVVDNLVYNHIAGLHPHLMRRFLASDLKVRIAGKDEKIAKGLKQKIRDDIHEQGGYSLIDDVLKDGEICHNGTAKLWWSRVWGPKDRREVVVTEEQLRQLVEDPRFFFSQEDVTALPPRQAFINDGIPTPDNPSGTEIEVTGAQMYHVALTFSDLLESGPIIASMPPEEFVTERGKARINDRYGVGHIRTILAGELVRENERRSTPEEPYYTRLAEAVAASKSTLLSTSADQDRRDREDLAWSGMEAVPGESMRKECEVIEWCGWADTGSDLTPVFAVFCNEIPIRIEENEEGIIPYCTWTPIPTPHSIIGQSSASVHVDRQNVRTVLRRALLDNIAMSVDKPKWVRNRGTDMLGLQNVTPGKLLFGNPEDVQEMDTAQLDYRLFQILEYEKAEAEEAGPATRLNQGVDQGPGGNDTATGIQIVQRASFNKIDLVAMAFSELFLVDLYNKLIILYQKNLDLPVVVKVDGEEVTLTRKSIQGRYTAHSDLGAAVDFDDRAFGQANATLAMAVGLVKQGVYPFAPPALREMVKDVLIAGGKSEPTKYLETFVPPSPQMPQGGSQMPAVAPGGVPQGDGTLVGTTANPGAGMGPGE